jgi:membrane associated rhomboid family serine protease
MLASILEDVKREYRLGTMVTRLVILNVAAFLALNLLRLILWIIHAGQVHPLYYQIRRFLTLSSDPWFDLTHPWVLFTAMFLHEGFFHLLWNMLFLYWFGRIVGDLIGNHRILPIYLLGGLFAGLIFILSAQVLGYGRAGEVHALGASGAVMAIVVSSAMIAPDYRIHLIIIGEVRLKYLVAALVVLDLIGLAGNVNTGGHFAHLGGAFFGYLFVVLLRSGTDLSAPVNQVVLALENLFQRRRSKPRLVYRNKRPPVIKTGPAPQDEQARLDAILEKIKFKGIESLRPDEKDFLENQSRGE